MASKSVVTSGFYEQVVSALKSLEKDPKIGKLKLAMLVPSRGFRNSWSLVVSSAELDKLGLTSATRLVLDGLKRSLHDKASWIDTVTILRTKQSIVEQLGEEFDIAEVGTVYEAHGMEPFALNLEEPVLFVAKAA